MKKTFLRTLLVLALAFTLMFAGCTVTPNEPTEPTDAPTDPVCEHVWVDATCTAPKTCSVCGATEGEALGHTEEIVAGTNATCTENGLTEGKKCSVCGETLVAQDAIPAEGHKDENKDFACDICSTDLCTDHAEEAITGKPATCTESGLTEGKKCSICGDIIVAQEVIPATGHAEETLAGKAATCTEAGLTEGKKCTVCGETTVAQENIPAAGHTEETLAAKDATCTEIGLTEGKKCTACGETTVAQDTIPATGHTNDAICGVCGGENPDFIPSNALVDDLEHMPLDGNYTYESWGYLGKNLVLDGVVTPYTIGTQAEAIRIVTDAHRGQKAVEFQKDSQNTSANIYISLTAEQIAALSTEGATMSFWYKVNGNAAVKISDVDCGAGATVWTKYVLSEEQIAYAIKPGNSCLRIEMYGTWNMASVWVDDIVIVPGEEKPVDPEPNNSIVLDYEGLTADRLEVVQSGSTGKQLNIDGVKAADIGYNAANAGISTESYNGTSSLWLQKGGSDTHTSFYIMLSEEQVAALKNGATMFFWYKTTAGGVKINGTDVGTAATEWTKVEMDAAWAAYYADHGFLRIEPYGTWDAVSYYIDDITVVPAN